MSHVLPEGALITHRRSPGPPPSSQRSGTSTCPPGLLVCTPALRPGGPGPSRAITTAGTLQDVRRNPHRTNDEIQDDSDARRLPTVYLLQYPTTVPRDSGENDDLHAPLMYAAPPCDYKRRRRAPLSRVLDSSRLGLPGFSPQEDAQGLPSTSSQPTPLLAETWELPSLSRLACIPYYKHSGCKIIQCPRTPLCWTYDPAAGIRINLCVSMLPLASTI